MYNPMDLTNKTILVTGASSGIGRATAIMLSHLGARVVLTGRQQDALKQTLQCMAGHSHIVEPYDLSQEDGIVSWLKGVANRHGIQFHGLVHSAGVSKIVPIRALSPANIDAMLGPNLRAALLLLKGLTTKDMSVDGSSFVFISSVAGHAGSPGLSAYAASKGGLTAMVRAAAQELSTRNIRVNCVAPGMVQTPMHEDHGLVGGVGFQASVERHPLGLGTPEDVAAACSFLLSPAARWITGTTLMVDGGYLS